MVSMDRTNAGRIGSEYVIDASLIPIGVQHLVSRFGGVFSSISLTLFYHVGCPLLACWFGFPRVLLCDSSSRLHTVCLEKEDL